MPSALPRSLRFVASLIPAAAVLLAFVSVAGFVATRLGGGLGLGLGLLAGASLGLGLTLGYWVLVDLLNLRVLRRGAGLEDAAGGIVAFEGVVRVSGDALHAPFSGVPCAAYTYVVAASLQSGAGRGSRRRVLAQGFHLTDTHIDGTAHRLRLRALPDVEDGLRRNERGTTWGTQARALVASLEGAARAGEAERESRLLEARRGGFDSVHQDYCTGTLGAHLDGLVIDETTLPIGERVCVIGTYEPESRTLSGRLGRIGPNVMVYRGSADEVLARVGGETRGYTTAVLVLVGIAVLVLAFALATPAAG
ncbi:MAG: hypothetical protein R2712_13665 [Vicinamibacterales bacterium]